MNHPCTLCGSRNWPDPHSTCPLCQPESAQEPETDRNPDENQFDNLAATK
jgi:hypothetical protein